MKELVHWNVVENTKVDSQIAMDLEICGTIHKQMKIQFFLSMKIS